MSLASGLKTDFPFVIREFKFEIQRCNPKGCERVAGGRSEAKTTGRQATSPHPDGVPDKKGMQEILFVTPAPLRGATLF